MNFKILVYEDGYRRRFAGGVARNPCICHPLEKALGTDILVPENPQMVGALGAAILGSENG